MGQSVIGADITPEPTTGAIAVRQRPEAVALGLFAVAAICAADLLLGSGLQVTGLLTTPPFLTAMFVLPRRTAFVGVVSVAANLLLAAQAGVLTEGGQITRLVGVVIAAVAAVGLTEIRVREQTRALSLAHIAEVAQLAVLRTLPARVGPANLGVRYVSATAEARVGGDFYEALPVEGGMRAIVGDVRGKGLGSVQLANVLIGAFRGADHDKLELDAVARGMDAAFTRFDPSDEDFATAVLVELSDDGTLAVANCGHPAPLLVNWEGVSELKPPRPTLPLGLGSNPSVGQHHLRHGDRVLLFTDGILEARRARTVFDLRAHAAPLASGNPDGALEALVAELRAFLQARISDDVALLLLERR